jgi:hypothetical protein
LLVDVACQCQRLSHSLQRLSRRSGEIYHRADLFRAFDVNRLFSRWPDTC